MGRAVLILAAVLPLLLAGCAPEPTSRELLLQGVYEVRTVQRRQRADIEAMHKQLREIDSLILLYEQQR